ncbi:MULTISPECIES: hypoxanthine phosphoribosyltransferase [unclassified Lactobacillus]|uniref:hypoxanthine phosphoribosyltransferase n=1 Tax=unclassified Lactobacillus TaxID=2620435 RepID=UPI000EFC7730|nr:MULTISPECIES: hypoxanthine phosphoribosyltransferase [unclassified Lactobacillus]RMC40650.1 hypoxanthine phosphoribosyltransferase [Lactobacillus sp. ESL0237]RMC44408.1 hypoxanthine phosphoribosyltransferase [Lactobacillus sp. ESL0234]RMC45714.1 hypoxanthine phosphoribosyltransferase [Lactobacillus sp. ESL0236]RMC46031.1 hypoxanthine phosphoribosyltransferase [Lactobacillus sp. ESL0230]RMC51108.1 hypoxanthine phosphoribosyltransferase [Lactobacillus sp. ESL0225]
MPKNDNINSIIDHKLFTEDDIHEMCVKLGKQLTQDYAGKQPLIVGALKGAIFFLTDLVREMDVKEEIDFLDVSSYGNELESSGKVDLISDLQTDVKNRDVLIVEDIVDTGLTLKYVKDLLKKRGAKSVKCCVLLNKETNRRTDVEIEYYGSKVGNEFVVGYGLDFMNFYRNLRFIGVLKPEVIASLKNN